jgi:hypothetical protein
MVGPQLGDVGVAERGGTLLDLARVAAAGARRRKMLVTCVFVVCAGAFAALYAMKRPTYRAEARILTLDRIALPTAARSVYEEPPTRSAYELIHRRDNLVALLRQNDLLPEGSGSDGGAGGADDRLNGVVTKLDRQLDVTVDQGAITIAVEWEDARQAYALTKAALDNFLEARHLQEVSSIDEVISVLEGHVSKLRRELDAALTDAQRREASQPRPVAPRARQPSPELVRLESLLAAKQRALQDVEEFRRRRVADLQAQLDQARNSLSDVHPTVIGLRKDIEAASRESPQVQAIRQEEQDVRVRYNDRLARERLSPGASSSVVPQVIETGAREEDPRVRQAQSQYDQMEARLNAARVELDAARAAFKYRYNVIWPPQVPDAPVSPNAQKIFGVGLLASVLIALLAGAAPDVLAGRLVHRVQVEALGVTVLGEVDRA